MPSRARDIEIESFKPLLLAERFTTVQDHQNSALPLLLTYITALKVPMNRASSKSPTRLEAFSYSINLSQRECTSTECCLGGPPCPIRMPMGGPAEAGKPNPARLTSFRLPAINMAALGFSWNSPCACDLPAGVVGWSHYPRQGNPRAALFSI